MFAPIYFRAIGIKIATDSEEMLQASGDIFCLQTKGQASIEERLLTRKNRQITIKVAQK